MCVCARERTRDIEKRRLKRKKVKKKNKKKKKLKKKGIRGYSCRKARSWHAYTLSYVLRETFFFFFPNSSNKMKSALIIIIIVIRFFTALFSFSSLEFLLSRRNRFCVRIVERWRRNNIEREKKKRRNGGEGIVSR